MTRRVTINLSLPFLLAADETRRSSDVAIDIQQGLSKLLFDHVKPGELTGLESVVYKQTDFTEGTDGICRVGNHPFTVPSMYDRPGKPAPDICWQHYQEERDNFWETTFAEPLGKLRVLGFDAAIVNTGGGCMNLEVLIDHDRADRKFDGIDRPVRFGFGDPDDGPLLDHLPEHGWGGAVYIDQGDGYVEYLDNSDETGNDIVELLDRLILSARRYCAANPKES